MVDANAKNLENEISDTKSKRDASIINNMAQEMWIPKTPLWKRKDFTLIQNKRTECRMETQFSLWLNLYRCKVTRQYEIFQVPIYVYSGGNLQVLP